MNIIPIQKLQIKSDYSAKIVAEKLSLETDQRMFFRKNNSNKKFEGKVHNTSFNINRILNYRNSFYPIISGKIISEENSKTTIKITMCMTIYANVFMCIWFIITGTVFIFALKQQIENEVFEYKPILWSLLFILVGYFLMIISFTAEAKTARKILTEIL